MTAAKEVIAAAIPEALADITYAKDVGELGVDGWIYPAELSATILAALDAAGYAVVPIHKREGTHVVHSGGLVYILHPDIPPHIWDGQTMERIVFGTKQE